MDAVIARCEPRFPYYESFADGHETFRGMVFWGPAGYEVAMRGSFKSYYARAATRVFQEYFTNHYVSYPGVTDCVRITWDEKPHLYYLHSVAMDGRVSNDIDFLPIFDGVESIRQLRESRTA